MIAGFTFTLANASYHIRGDDHDWLAQCSAEFVDTSPNDFPLRGDVTFLNAIQAEITIKLRRDGSLNRSMMATGLDEQVAQWRKEGYLCNSDAYLMRYWPKSKDYPEFLGMTTVLTESKFARFHDFMLRHIGRADLRVRIGGSFQGFSEPDYQAPTLPTKAAFLGGQPYFVADDQTITIGAALP
jgi:hypothetical protein